MARAEQLMCVRKSQGEDGLTGEWLPPPAAAAAAITAAPPPAKPRMIHPLWLFAAVEPTVVVVVGEGGAGWGCVGPVDSGGAAGGCSTVGGVVSGTGGAGVSGLSWPEVEMTDDCPD